MRFDLFRYQILPKDRHVQGDLFEDIKSVDDLIAQKNKLFFEALAKIATLSGTKSQVLWSPLSLHADFSLIRLAPNRSLRRETENFTEEAIPNWPSILVGIWNDPLKQLIYVQERPEAFQSTDTVVRAITSTISNILSEKQLRVYFEAITDPVDFWKLVRRHQEKITEVRFELITPNMANISGVLSDDVRSFAKETNSAKTNLSLTADPDAALRLDPKNAQLSGIVSYAAAGGGNISIKAKNVRRRINTSESKKTFDVDDLQIQANSPQEIESIFKSMFT